MGEGTADVIPVLVVHTKRCGEMIGDGAVFILKKVKKSIPKAAFSLAEKYCISIGRFDTGKTLHFYWEFIYQ